MLTRHPCNSMPHALGEGRRYGFTHKVQHQPLNGALLRRYTMSKLHLFVLVVSILVMSALSSCKDVGGDVINHIQNGCSDNRTMVTCNQQLP